MVLVKLKNNGCINKLKATSIRKLSSGMDISYFTIRNILKALTYAGLCSKGYPDGNAHTYFITSEGIELLNNLKGDM